MRLFYRSSPCVRLSGAKHARTNPYAYWARSSSTRGRILLCLPKRCPGTISAFDSLYEQGGIEMGADGERLLGQAPSLLRRGSARGDARPISLDDPPAGVPDGTVVDVSWTGERVGRLRRIPLVFRDRCIRCGGTPRTTGLRGSRPAEQLPENADGEKPIVSNVGYYVPYPGDSVAYCIMAGAFVVSVPVILPSAYCCGAPLLPRARLAGPVAG